MRTALCLTLCLFLTGCSLSEKKDPEDTIPPPPPLSTQMDGYTLGDIVINSMGGYTGYVGIDDESVEIHPYFNLEECITARIIYTSGQSWWEVATTDLPVTDMGAYQLVQNIDGSAYGYMPIDDEHGIFVNTETLSLGYVKLYMDNVWISDT